MPHLLKRRGPTSTTKENYQQAMVAHSNCAKMSRPRRGDRLCVRCQSLDLQQLFQIHKSHKAGHKSWKATVLSLGIVQPSMSRSSCPLCRLFATLAIQGGHKATYKTFALKAHSALHHHFRHTHRKNHAQDTVILSLASHGTVMWNPDIERKRGIIYLVGEQDKHHGQSIVGNIVNPYRVDYELAKQWIQFCSTNHEGYCKHQPSTAAYNIPGFKAIDCQTRRVVEHTSAAEYVALSYVWGHASHVSTRSLPNPAARVIEDAITVTKELGFRYLWVDRYCISQVDAIENHEQISRMDQIYAGAVVTLVAAAGEDPHYGLPGVSHTRRRAQPRASVGQFDMVSSLLPPQDTVKLSKWASRVWTLQEARLSRRILLFTDYQMVFECASMACQETIRVPLAALHREIQKSTNHDVMRIFPANGPGTSLADFLDIITEYTSRCLTNEADNINALLGIFNSFSNTEANFWCPPEPNNRVYFAHSSSAGMCHLWGLPFLPKVITGRDLMNASFCAMLAWHSDIPSTRCPEFPSWTWAGWKLPKKTTFCVRDISREYNCKLRSVEVRLCLGAGRELRLDELGDESNLSKTLKETPRVLYVRGPVGEVKFHLAYSERLLHNIGGLFGNSLEFFPDVKMSSDELKQFTKHSYSTLRLTYEYLDRFLVLKRVGHEYERIGIICSPRMPWGVGPALHCSLQERVQTIMLR